MTLNAPIPLGGHHELAEFNSNVPDLDDWLRRRARTNRAGGTSRTFVGCGGSRVIAYYALKFIQLLNVRVADSTLISKNERVKSLYGRYFSLYFFRNMLLSGLGP